MTKELKKYIKINALSDILIIIGLIFMITVYIILNIATILISFLGGALALTGIILKIIRIEKKLAKYINYNNILLMFIINFLIICITILIIIQ